MTTAVAETKTTLDDIAELREKIHLGRHLSQQEIERILLEMSVHMRMVYQDDGEDIFEALSQNNYEMVQNKLMERARHGKGELATYALSGSAILETIRVRAFLITAFESLMAEVYSLRYDLSVA